MVLKHCYSSKTEIFNYTSHAECTESNSYSMRNILQNNVEKLFNKKLFNIIQDLWKLNSRIKTGGENLSSRLGIKIQL